MRVKKRSNKAQNIEMISQERTSPIEEVSLFMRAMSQPELVLSK
jgi:hypothetical protein